MLACCLVAMLVAVNLGCFSSLRPQLLSFLSYAAAGAPPGGPRLGGVPRVPWLYRFEPPPAVRQPVEVDHQRFVWLSLRPGIMMLSTNFHTVSSPADASGRPLSCRSVEALGRGVP